MATNKITITAGGVPAEGATILVGDTLGQELVTNFRGNVNFDMSPNFKAWVFMKITLADGRPALVSGVLETGVDQIIDLPPE